MKKEVYRKLEEIKKVEKVVVISIDFRDFMLLELLVWFKNFFFSWVDVLKCDNCGGEI